MSDPAPSSHSSPTPPPNTPGSGATMLVILFGVILPAVVVVVEVGWHFCGGVFFDPIPTVGHAVLVSLVPIANALAWASHFRGRRRGDSLLGVLNGMAIVIALFYSIVFLPLLPLALIATIYFGLGLLPLAPLLSTVVAIVCRARMRKAGTRRQWAGVVVGMVALATVEAPHAAAQIGLHWANSTSPATRRAGLRLIRSWGHEETVRRACYFNSEWRMPDFVGCLGSAFSGPVSPMDARRIYYQATGLAFDDPSDPDLGPDSRFDRDMGFDWGRRTRTARWQVQGLSLVSSGMEGSLDPAALLGYLEWTLVLRNHGPAQQEARAIVALPHDGVVSRLTLWVEGKEREARYGPRHKTQEAYERVVQGRRDPVLVTTVSPDRVLVQCFPVPPGDGEMKVRLGITFPLQRDDPSQWSLRLPCFAERNFEVDGAFRHIVNLGSPLRLRIHVGAPARALPGADRTTSNAALSDGELSSLEPALVGELPAEAGEAWAADQVAGDGSLVRQRLVSPPGKRPARVVLVVDGSRGMRESSDKVADALATMPEGIPVRGVFAGDEPDAWEEATCTAIARRVREAEYLGGRDNGAALHTARKLASPDGVVVWIHAPIPFADRGERSPADGSGTATLYDFEVGLGPNRAMEQLDGSWCSWSIPRREGVQADLTRFFTDWSSPTHPIVVRERLETLPPGQRPRHEASSHLAHLWAHARVLDLVRLNRHETDQEALELAFKYRLVTPVTGAVVLETDDQYGLAGLSQTNAGTVPTVPEPEMIALMIAVAAILAVAVARRRRAACSPARSC